MKWNVAWEREVWYPHLHSADDTLVHIGNKTISFDAVCQKGSESELRPR